MGLGKTVESISNHNLDTSSVEAFCIDLGNRLEVNIILSSYNMISEKPSEKVYSLGYADSLEVYVEFEEDQTTPWYYKIDKYKNIPFEYLEIFVSGFVQTFTNFPCGWSWGHFMEELICQFKDYNNRQEYVDVRNALISFWKKLGCRESIIYTEYNYLTMVELESDDKLYFTGKDIHFLKSELIEKDEIRFYDFPPILETTFEIPDPYQHKLNIKDKTKYHGEYGIMLYDDFREVI